MVMAWKVPKFGILHKIAPFLKFAHIKVSLPEMEVLQGQKIAL